MSFEGTIQGDDPLTQHESPSDLTEQTVEAVEVEPTAEPMQTEASGEPGPAQRGEATREAMAFFIGNIASATAPMTEAEFQQLRTSIDDDGQQVAITVRKAGDGRLEIIDGAHRHRACAELGKNVKCVEVAGSDEEMRELSDRLNEKRRHLTQARLAKWVVDRTVAKPEGNPAENSATTAKFKKALKLKAEELGVGVGDIKPRAELAKLKGVSERSVQMAARIKKESPEAYEKIDSEGLSLEGALELARKRKREAEQWNHLDSHGSNAENGKPEPSGDEKSKKAVEKMRVAIINVIRDHFPKEKDKGRFITVAQELCTILGIEWSPRDIITSSLN